MPYIGAFVNYLLDIFLLTYYLLEIYCKQFLQQVEKMVNDRKTDS